MDLLRTKSMGELRTGIREHFAASIESIGTVKQRVVDMLVEFAVKLEGRGYFSTNEELRDSKLVHFVYQWTWLLVIRTAVIRTYFSTPTSVLMTGIHCTYYSVY